MLLIAKRNKIDGKVLSKMQTQCNTFNCETKGNEHEYSVIDRIAMHGL